MPRAIAVTACLAGLVVIGACAGSAWREARSADSIAAYQEFLKEYPDATFSEEARARLELARVRHRPSRDSYEAFRESYGTPERLDELRPHVEEVFFTHARAFGTAAAYREFLAEQPDGRFAARARGNLAYLEAGGFGGNVGALAAFAEEHPESDHAAEAERSLAAVEARTRTRFRRVGLAIAVAASTPGRERVMRVFRDRAVAAYAAAGLELVRLSTPEKAREAGLAAVLEIRHDESETTTQLERGTVTEPGVLARTEVTLRRVGESLPIWSDAFEYRAPLSARREDVSILFGPGSHASYWAELDGAFFVPIARWSTQVTARAPWALEKPPVAVEVVGSAAVVLYGDGDFELVDLGDPAQPVRLGEYRRPRDLSRFGGVAVDGSEVVLFGPDGLEIVRLAGDRTRREAALGRDRVGSVVDVTRIAGEWIAATNRGLLRIDASPEAVETLVPREILGMARAADDRVVFADGVSLYTATLSQLRAGRVESELRLGRGFHPQRVRVYGQGTSAVVLGTRDAVWVDLRAGRPRLRSRIGGSESGRVRDAAVVGSRLFLLGPRGLQVADRSGERIEDSVDVRARERIDVAGRHLVMIGDRSLQVVDATAFVASAPASNERR